MAPSRTRLRRRIRRDRLGVRTLLAIALSLGANAGLLWALLSAGAFAFRAPGPARPVALTHLSQSQWDANRAIGNRPPPPPSAAPAPQAPPVPPPEEQRAAGKVVELAPDAPGEDAAPKDSRFLSERNRRVEKETVSRYAGNSQNLRSQPSPASPGRQASGEGGKAERKTEAKEGAPGQRGTGADRLRMPQQEQKPEQAQEKLALAPSAGGETPLHEQQRRERVEQGAPSPALPGAPGDGSDRLQGPKRPDLSLGQDTLARLAGGPNMDGFREAEEGDVTALNTREFKYATFFNQVRREIGADWYPRVRAAVRERDPEFKHFFYKERTVVVSVTLDRSGHVTDLSVLQSSNVDFFDRVAMASVRQAQPFPNPPGGLFGSEPTTRVPFTFTLYPSDRRPFVMWERPEQ
ncbi:MULTISPECIES: energy transducer TonB [Anaeromyxobacter]|uniref:energy transducer TonB family protein n=1 Tax=Anaeromyxobacter TaxID=161492 RepID=UPI001F57A591|nr:MULTISPECIES: energy transducer TonB [unclassified Anaeromyxobacter]